MHEAAEVAITEHDIRYFVRLLDLQFPLYEPDTKNQLAPFMISLVEEMSDFKSCFMALVNSGFAITETDVRN